MHSYICGMVNSIVVIQWQVRNLLTMKFVNCKVELLRMVSVAFWPFWAWWHAALAGAVKVAACSRSPFQTSSLEKQTLRTLFGTTC